MPDFLGNVDSALETKFSVDFQAVVKYLLNVWQVSNKGVGSIVDKSIKSMMGGTLGLHSAVRTRVLSA